MTKYQAQKLNELVGWKVIDSNDKEIIGDDLLIESPEGKQYILDLEGELYEPYIYKGVYNSYLNQGKT